MYNIAVIGGGVIGITSALVIQKDLKSLATVSVFTEKLSPYTTGDVSAGLWAAYLLQETNPDDITRWSKATWHYYLDLWKKGHAGEVGVTLQPVTKFFEEADSSPAWLDAAFGNQAISAEYLAKLNRKFRKQYRAGYTCVDLTLEPAKFLPYLQNKFMKNGGRIIIRKITNFQQLADYDIIVNCTGVYSKALTEDDQLEPVRGQAVRVNAPWQFHTIMAGDSYIIPNCDSVVLGGTSQVGDWDTNPRESDAKGILDNCCSFIPALQNAPIIAHNVGLRPGRNKVRLELEIKNINGNDFKIVHCYGHGGGGVSLSYGCALEVNDLVKQALNIPTISKL